MSTAQSGICPDNNRHASFLTLLVKDGEDYSQAVRAAAAALPGLNEELAKIDPEAGLVSTIGFGSAAWDRLFSGPRPKQLAPFRAMEGNGNIAPSTPADVLIHIRSNRADLNFILVDAVMQLLGDAVVIIEQTDGFRYLDSRDLTGFVDGTENPDEDERPAVALVGDSDPAFAGGSYAHCQRYIHDMDSWNELAVPHQEGIVGRTKADDQELDDDTKPDSAHIARVVIEEDGEELEILRMSMPYGDSYESGLFFIAYCFTPERFENMLSRMVEGDEDGTYDHLMDYTQAVTGAAFFMPSVEFLQSQT